MWHCLHGTSQCLRPDLDIGILHNISRYAPIWKQETPGFLSCGRWISDSWIREGVRLYGGPSLVTFAALSTRPGGYCSGEIRLAWSQGVKRFLPCLSCTWYSCLETHVLRQIDDSENIEEAEIKRLLGTIHSNKDFRYWTKLHITAVVTVLEWPVPYNPPYITLWTWLGAVSLRGMFFT